MESDLAPLTEAFYRRKVSQIQNRLYENRVDGLLLLNTHNVIYASGFFHSPTERPIGFYVPSRGEPILFIPLLEQENAGETWIGDIRTYFEFPGEENPILWMARECGARRLGLDSISHVIFEQVRRLGVMPTVTNLVEKLRHIKEPEELLLVAQAARYADVCLQYIKDQTSNILQDGGTEVDILHAGLTSTRERMHKELGSAFRHIKNSIVGSVHTGPRAALPHGKPIDRSPNMGDVLIAGIGASVGGYHGESGATFILGEATAEQLHCLRTTAACDAATAASLRPGITCSEVNSAALDVLDEAGYKGHIRHRIGHGMGVQGHEGPWLAPGDKTKLQPAMVFSSEPGIYRPGIDGYRTINTFIVTPGEAHIASRFLAANPPENRVIAI